MLFNSNKYLAEIIGKTCVSVTQTGDESITFVTTEGTEFVMYYEADCCAQCSINDVSGDLQDLVGSPLLIAECVTSDEGAILSESGYEPDSFTWTFYKFATAKGHVTVRWYGTSNGYYSETATFIRKGASFYE